MQGEGHVAHCGTKRTHTRSRTAMKLVLGGSLLGVVDGDYEKHALHGIVLSRLYETISIQIMFGQGRSNELAPFYPGVLLFRRASTWKIRRCCCEQRSIKQIYSIPRELQFSEDALLTASTECANFWAKLGRPFG
jgi:hypothetical protein